MTDKELKAIEARANAATVGPWNTGEEESNPGRCRGIWPGDEEHLEIVTTDSGVYGPKMPDAIFIAAARSDVPALVAEVRRLRAEVERLELDEDEPPTAEELAEDARRAEERLAARMTPARSLVEQMDRDISDMTGHIVSSLGRTLYDNSRTNLGIMAGLLPK